MDELYNAIAAIIEQKRRANEPRIKASWVANEALRDLDPGRISVPAVYAGCAEFAKQHARSLLQKTNDPTQRDNSQYEMFTNLQGYYPAARSKDKDPEYLRLEYAIMSDADVDYNVRRMRRASESLAKHADALETWGNRRPRQAA